MPRVSVITPAHDSAETISAAVASVREQTFGDWEHIVADDASRDETATILDRLAGEDSRLRVVGSDTNRGPAGARNFAIEAASGQLLAFLDADDRLLPGYLDQLVSLYDRAVGRGRRIGIVACNAYLVSASGRASETYADRYGGADGITLTALLRSNSIFVSAMCPGQVVRDAGGFSTECWGSEDHDLWLRIVELGYDVIGTSEPLVEYRLAAGSVSSSRIGMAQTTQATYRRALERGRLDARQRRIARAGLRTARAAEAFERLAAGRQARWRSRLLEAAQALPAFAAAALTQPGRWPHWTRLVLARARRS
jgi:cellulose synthase/poly-beta-1,6-N-acetylglucosamine synthase-like glycosyltransferase